MFVLDEASQQKLLSLLVAGSGGCGGGGDGGDGGGVATCSLAADANVLVAAVNDRLKVQQQCNAEVQVSETVLCTSESSTCSSVQEEQVICDQVLSSNDKIDSTRDFANVRDVEGEFQNAESLNTDPLMFLASAAEEVKSMMEIGDISANEEGHGGQIHVGWLRSIGTSMDGISTNEGGLPLNSTRKEINTTGQLRSSPTHEDNPVIKAISSSPRASSKNLTNSDFNDQATSVDSKTVHNLLSDPQHTTDSASQPLSQPNLPPNSSSHKLQQESTNLLSSSDSAVGKTQSLLNAEEQKVKLVHSELSTRESKTISNLGRGEGMDSRDVLTEAKLVDEGLMSLLQKAVDIEGVQSEQFAAGDENLMEYCLKMVDQQVSGSPEDAQLANLAMMDEFQLGEANENVVTELPPAPVVDGAGRVKGHENAELAVLHVAVVCKGQQVEENKTEELELPSVPFNDDVHNLNSLDADVESADSAVMSTVSATDIRVPAIPSNDGTSNDVSTHKENVQSADLSVHLSLEMSKSGESPSSLLSDETDDAGPCPFDLTSLASDEAQFPQSGPPISDTIEEPFRSKEDNSKECVQSPEIQLASTISSNILNDRNMRDCEELMDTAPLPVVAPPQARVSDSPTNEDHRNNSNGANNFRLEQQSPNENRNRISVQVRVNFSPPTSNNDMNAKLCYKESEIPSNVHASSPVLPPSSVSKIITSQEAITTLSSPVSNIVNKDQNITEDFAPSPIFTATSRTINPLNRDESNTSESARATLAVTQQLGCGIEHKSVPSEEHAMTDGVVEMDVQSGVNNLKGFTDMSHCVVSMETAISLDAEHEIKVQRTPTERCKGSEKGHIQSGDNRLTECVSVASHRAESALPMDTDKAASPVNTELEVGNDKHDGIREVLNDQSGDNDVAGSAHTQSVESNVCVPLIPELQRPFHLIKEQSHSDDAEDTDDHADSSHTTKSTDACLTQSAESANCVDSELEQQLVPFKEHLLPSDCNEDNADDRNDDVSQLTTASACICTTPSIEQQCTEGTDVLPANALVESNGDHKHDHIDSDLPPSDLTTEIHDQIIEDDRLSSTSGIITTSACFRKEWSDTNSDSQSSTAGLLSRSGSYNLSDSFSSCDQCSLGDCTKSDVHNSSPERVSDPPHESVSGEKTVKRPTSLSSSSFRRKKTWDSGFYAASKIIMTRSKFADLRRIGDDFTISQALTSPFHDISSDGFGSGSPEEEEEEEEECPSKTAGHHQFGRSLSVSSMESASSSVGSLQGDDSSGR